MKGKKLGAKAMSYKAAGCKVSGGAYSEDRTAGNPTAGNRPAQDGTPSFVGTHRQSTGVRKFKGHHRKG